jgi:hypothetical protein
MPEPGAVAEWLGRGLQSLVQRFDSARRLSCQGDQAEQPSSLSSENAAVTSPSGVTVMCVSVLKV